MFVQPEISRKQALTILSGQNTNPSRLKKFLRTNKPIFPERVELLHLPFYLFFVLVKKETNQQSIGQTEMQMVSLAVDGLLGHAVLYIGEELNYEETSKNRPLAVPFEISSTLAANRALEQYRGILLEYGLRTRSRHDASEISDEKKIFYPFWIGYFKKKSGYDFKAMDAVSGTIQDIRMRRLIIRALRLLGNNSNSPPR
jgi:hypothetical protein